MHQFFRSVLHFASEKPRLFAALWFAGFSLVGTTAVFIFNGIKTEPIMLCLYLVLPMASAAVVGYFYGASILDPRRTKSYKQAILRGIWLALLTFIVFAPFLVVFYSLTHGERFPQLSQLFVLVLVFLFGGIILSFPVILTVGAIGAAALYTLGRRAFQNDGD